MNERYAIAERMRNDGKATAEIARVLGVTRTRVLQILKADNEQRLAEDEIGEAVTYSSLHLRVRRHLLREFRDDAYPPLSKVREMEQSWYLKKIPNLGKLSIQIIDEWLTSHGA